MALKTKNLYTPHTEKPYRMSRSSIESFTGCPRCFYLDKRRGVEPPSGLPFNLNSAVDALLKKEFDFYRERKEPHPLMTQYKIDAIPFSHADLNKWRANTSGVRFHHLETNFLITGAVDDIWVDSRGKLIVVDYKSTAKNDEITSLDLPWHDGYKRQMEIYQWLLRKNGFEVSDTCYWVYANGDKSKDRFDATLTFRMTVIPYKSSDKWIEKTLQNIKACLDSDKLPQASKYCELCGYVADLKECDR